MTPVPPDIHPDGRYSTAQAARILGIHRATLWRLAKSGAICPGIDRRTAKARYRGKDLIRLWRTQAG